MKQIYLWNLSPFTSTIILISSDIHRCTISCCDAKHMLPILHQFSSTIDMSANCHTDHQDFEIKKRPSANSLSCTYKFPVQDFINSCKLYISHIATAWIVPHSLNCSAQTSSIYLFKAKVDEFNTEEEEKNLSLPCIKKIQKIKGKPKGLEL